jgi:RND superfamily putative drug exporter
VAGSINIVALRSVPGMAEIKGIAARTAGWSMRHRALAVIGWLVFVAGTVVLSGVLGTIDDETGGNHGESARAEKLINAADFPERSGEMVLVRAKDGRTIDDPEVQAALAELTRALDATGVATERSKALPSEDRSAALVAFDLAKADDVDRTLAAVDGVQKAHPSLDVAEAGDASGDKFIGEELDKILNKVGIGSLAVTFGILLVAFGAVVAALLPVGLAITAVIAAMGLVALASRAAPLSDTTPHVMLLIGLAVGVDYCLFYIRREREERARGNDKDRALLIAAQTSGRSIWISGLTVMVAMAGLLFTGDSTFVSVGLGTMLVVATAVLGSLTVLPALLSLLGDKINVGRIRRRKAVHSARSTGRFWRAVLAVVLRRPLVSAILAVLALGALATPALRLNIQGEGLEDFGDSIPTINTFRDIRDEFPGGAEPARVVVAADDVTAAPVTAAIEKFRAEALKTGQLHEPIAVVVSPDRSVAIVSVGLSGSGTDAATVKALKLLRGTVIPSVFHDVPQVRDVAVGGEAAGSYDFNQSLHRSMPLVFLFVLGLTFVLVLLSFRSLVIAATTIVLNLLSVAAAYGVLVLVFQDGHGAGLLDFTPSGGITDWLPLLLFVILFGLSMDYHVFVLSRIREGYDRGLTTRQAIADGIAGTAGAITSAAVVMVGVFGLFAFMPLTSMKQIGLGLSVAVLLDATLIRAILLPAVMALLGKTNWYLPRWLGWLPKIEHGAPSEPAATAPSTYPAAEPATAGAGAPH